MTSWKRIGRIALVDAPLVFAIACVVVTASVLEALKWPKQGAKK
jgi:hypothetical protein